MEKATHEQLRMRSPVARSPFGKHIVAIASKHARKLWVMLAREVDYDAHAQYRHSMHGTEVTP